MGPMSRGSSPRVHEPRTPPPDALAARVRSRDVARLWARQSTLDRDAVPADDPRRAALAREVEASAAARAARAASVPAIVLDESLPIAREAERIVELIRAHPVVVVAGETGSGKTTQLPKLCLAAGRGVAGMIGCTQPRRIAARSVARRVAEELKTPLGELVGFQVRFNDQVSERTLVKFMTDGILLAETQGDPSLSAYDTIIVDEAHERSLNIDFLLGYLKRLTAKRPRPQGHRDLRDDRHRALRAPFPQRAGGRCRRPQLSGRRAVSPIPARSRRTATSPRRSLATIDAVTAADPLGDVLVFLPGERGDPRNAPRAVAPQVPLDRGACRCTRGCRRATRTACSRRGRRAASCSRRTSRRPR